MPYIELSVELLLGVIASLIAAGLLWFFRKQLRESVAAIDMSSGALFGWLMAFVILAVFVAFPLMNKDVPAGLAIVFSILVVYLLMETARFVRR